MTTTTISRGRRSYGTTGHKGDGHEDESHPPPPRRRRPRRTAAGLRLPSMSEATRVTTSSSGSSGSISQRRRRASRVWSCPGRTDRARRALPRSPWATPFRRGYIALALALTAARDDEDGEELESDEVSWSPNRKNSYLRHLPSGPRGNTPRDPSP